MDSLKENNGILIKDSVNKAFTIVSNSSAFSKKRKFVTKKISSMQSLVFINDENLEVNEINKKDMFQDNDFLENIERIFSPIIQYEVITPPINSFRISSSTSSSSLTLLDSSLVTCFSNDIYSDSSNSILTLPSVSLSSPNMMICDNIENELSFVTITSTPKIDNNKASYVDINNYQDDVPINNNNKRRVVILSDNEHDTNDYILNSPLDIKDKYKNYKYSTNSDSFITNNVDNVYSSNAVSITPLSIEFSNTMNIK